MRFANNCPPFHPDVCAPLHKVQVMTVRRELSLHPVHLRADTDERGHPTLYPTWFQSGPRCTVMSSHARVQQFGARAKF